MAVRRRLHGWFHAHEERPAHRPLRPNHQAAPAAMVVGIALCRLLGALRRAAAHRPAPAAKAGAGQQAVVERRLQTLPTLLTRPWRMAFPHRLHGSFSPTVHSSSIHNFFPVFFDWFSLVLAICSSYWAGNTTRRRAYSSLCVVSSLPPLCPGPTNPADSPTLPPLPPNLRQARPRRVALPTPTPLLLHSTPSFAR